MFVYHFFHFPHVNIVHPCPVNIRQKATPSSAIDGGNAMLVGVGVRGPHWASGERERVEGMGWWNFNIWNPKWTFNSKFSFGKTFHSYKPNRVNVFWSKDSKLPNIPLRKWASKLQGSCKLSKGPWRKEAIKSEIDSILQNHRWKLVDPPSGCKPLGHKCIFKKKMKADGSIARQELWPRVYTWMSRLLWYVAVSSIGRAPSWLAISCQNTYLRVSHVIEWYFSFRYSFKCLFKEVERSQRVLYWANEW